MVEDPHPRHISLATGFLRGSANQEPGWRWGSRCWQRGCFYASSVTFVQSSGPWSCWRRLIPATTFIWQQGHQQAPGRFPAQRRLPTLGPSPSSWVPMIRSCLPADPAPGSRRDLPGPLQHLWSVLLTRPWLNRMVVLHGVITEPRLTAPGEQGNGGVQRGWSLC